MEISRVRNGLEKVEASSELTNHVISSVQRRHEMDSLFLLGWTNVNGCVA